MAGIIDDSDIAISDAMKHYMVSQYPQFAHKIVCQNSPEIPLVMLYSPKSFSITCMICRVPWL